jgi:transposase InsO family protein
VAIDYLSRWVEAKAVPDTSSKFVTKFIEKRILYKHGWFFRLISDQGSAFSSREFAEFCGNVRLKHIMCSAEHPESNGLVERVNRAIASTLAAFVNLKHDDWDVKLHQAVFAINSAKQSTTQKSPFELVYGRPAVTPDEVLFPWVPQMIEGEDDFIRKVARWRKVARSLILAQQRKSKTLADRFRNPDPVFKLGDLVLVARRRVCVGKTKKFVCRSIGPYQVV